MNNSWNVAAFGFVCEVDVAVVFCVPMPRKVKVPAWPTEFVRVACVDQDGNPTPDPDGNLDWVGDARDSGADPGKGF